MSTVATCNHSGSQRTHPGLSHPRWAGRVGNHVPSELDSSLGPFFSFTSWSVPRTPPCWLSYFLFGTVLKQWASISAFVASGTLATAERCSRNLFHHTDRWKGETGWLGGEDEFLGQGTAPPCSELEVRSDFPPHRGEEGPGAPVWCVEMFPQGSHLGCWFWSLHAGHFVGCSEERNRFYSHHFSLLEADSMHEGGMEYLVMVGQVLHPSYFPPKKTQLFPPCRDTWLALARLLWYSAENCAPGRGRGTYIYITGNGQLYWLGRCFQTKSFA